MALNRIRDLRKSFNFTQRQLSEMSGIAQQTLARWELGKVNLSPAMVRSVADIFRVSPEILLSSVPSPENDVQVWVIYVGIKPHLTSNYKLSRLHKVWGFNPLQSKAKDIWQLKVNDIVYFAHGVSWLRELGPCPPGFPRFLPRLDTFQYNFRELLQVKVTSPVFEDHRPIWENETYPFRFEYTEVNNHRDLRLGEDSSQHDLISTIFKSVRSQGRLVSLGRCEKKVSSSISLATTIVASNKKCIYPLLKNSNITDCVKEEKAHYHTNRGDGCEVCGFSFIDTYGVDHLEVFNTNKLSESLGETKVEDEVLICANCARMINDKNAPLSVSELKSIYNLRNK